MLTKHLYLAPRISVRGSISPVSLLAFMACGQRHLPFLCINFHLDCFRTELAPRPSDAAQLPAVTEYQLTQLITSCINSTRVNVHCLPER